MSSSSIVCGSMPSNMPAIIMLVPPSSSGVSSRPNASTLARISGVMSGVSYQQHGLDRLARVGIGESAVDLGEGVEAQQAVEREAALPPVVDQLGQEQAGVRVAPQDAA